MSSSRGLKTAMDEGENLVQKLEQKGLEPGIMFSVLAGNNSVLGIVPSSSSAASDGIIFIDSVLNTAGMSRRGAILQEKSILPLNHIELLYDRRVAAWIHRQISS